MTSESSIDNRQSTILPGLPHLLRPGLDIVFIGYNPGLESARVGHYYAFRGNVFWKQLNESGLVARRVSHVDDALLADEAAIGFTDLCCRPTARAGELTRAEIVEGALRLHGELLDYRPRFAVFSGRGIYQAFGRHALRLAATDLAARPYGAQLERIAAGPGAASTPFVIPSSSGLASKWHRERLEWLRQLAAILRAPAGP
jgi:TDG/mug DNA glycosylase family protein